MSRELQTELALLMHARFLRMRSMDRALRIHPGQFQILMVLQEQQGLTQRGVAGLLGVRTENLVVVVREKKSDEFGQFCTFDPLTLCPINKEAIEPSMLSKAEVRWLNDYHRTVFEQLSPMLEPEEVKWLGAATSPL